MYLGPNLASCLFWLTPYQWALIKVFTISSFLETHHFLCLNYYLLPRFYVQYFIKRGSFISCRNHVCHMLHGAQYSQLSQVFSHGILYTKKIIITSPIKRTAQSLSFKKERIVITNFCPINEHCVLLIPYHQIP